MNIKLIKGQRMPEETVEVEKGISREALYKRYEKELPYRVLLAKVDNKLEELGHKLHKGCSVEFIDMRSQSGNLVYQNSLTLLYLKAARDVLGSVEVCIENALNKGLFTEIKSADNITTKDVKAIESRMKEMVEADIPFIHEELTKDEAIREFEETGCPEKIQLLYENPHVKKVPFYSLDGYRNFFYGLMVPSTGYLEHFELRKYRRGILLRFPHPSDPSKIPDYVDEKTLYKTFGEQSRWGKLMGIKNVCDLNKKIEEGEFKELVQLSEALHERRIVEIADMIAKSKRRIVLIAGPSSSGKTTFAQRLCIQLKFN